MLIKEEWKEKGYVDAPIAEGIDLKKEILNLCKKKNAIILAHYYTNSSVQSIADFVGDSLALARKASNTNADIIVMCGVHFMGETCKILCPDKKVLVPDLNATCSLAESCPVKDFAEFCKKNPNHTVISYVNTSADVKSVTDIVVTSGNALQIVGSFPKDEKIIFGPDRNLGRYINEKNGRNMLLWDGACHVHERFTADAVIALKQQYPDAKVLVHPECNETVVKLADITGSTAELLKYASNSNETTFIVATESGILYEMRKKNPNKKFISVPHETKDKKMSCNECEYMRMNTLEKIFNCLSYEWPHIDVENQLCERALKPINRMLEISEKLGL